MANRQIQSPGVQISEVDLSLNPAAQSTTTIYVPGFAQKGPINDAVNITSIANFEQIYGTPTNGAERYFYNTVNAALQSPANIMVTRLPYGQTTIDKYGLLAFPAVYVDNSSGCTTTSVCANGSYSATTGVYVLGQPVHYSLTKDQYNSWRQGNLFTTGYATSATGPLDPTNINSISGAALVIGNQSVTDINGNFEGYYIGICDNTNVNLNTDYTIVRNVYSLSASDGTAGVGYTTLSPNRLGVALTGTQDQTGSISQTLVYNSATYDQGSRYFDDTISIALFKLTQSTFNNSSVALAASLAEVYHGSLDSHRLVNSVNGGPPTSFFIDTVASTSPNITVKTNPYLSRLIQGNGYQDATGNPAIKIRVASPAWIDSSTYSIAGTTYSGTTQIAATTATNATNRCTILGVSGTNTLNTILTAAGGQVDGIYPLGIYNPYNIQLKQIGNVPGKLQTIFGNFTNGDIYPFDIACEAGLGTIFAAACANNGVFDDFTYFNIGSAGAIDGSTAPTGLYATSNFSYSNSTPATNYCAVLDTFINLVNDFSRKDFIIIADPITNIFVQGNTFKQVNATGATIGQNIYVPMNNLYAKYNTSYVTTYANVVQVNDHSSGLQVWVPFSGTAAALMANTDANYQPWYAPAGFTRGLINNVTDIAIYPKQKDRDTLYKAGFNPVAFFPGDGFVVYGQKTMLSIPSAFDRINVRRLFLALEKATKATLKYYVFEPNTLLTRTKVVNSITPLFENAKNTQGVYDYLIICDERNNTPAIIDDNTMVVDIYIKPVRTAEFILCNFYATQTSVNLQEIAG